MANRVFELTQAIAVNGGLVRPDPWNVGNYISQIAAAGTVTITGSETDGDTLTLTFTSSQLPASHGFSAGTYAISILTAGSEALSAIATAFKNAINNDPLLSSLGVSATSVGAVITINWIPGPLGNKATMAFTNSGTTETATIVQFNGDSGYVIPQQDAIIVVNRCPINLNYGQPVAVDYAQLTAMIDAGISLK